MGAWLSRRLPALSPRGPEPAHARRLAVVGLSALLATGLAGDDVWEGTVAGFQSQPRLSPPTVTVKNPAPPGQSGYTFVAPWRGEGQAGPMILNRRGEMVWFRPAPPEQEAQDFRVQRYQGRSVLTWWEGYVDEDGFGHGEYVVADHNYREIARFRPADGRPGDFHEFVITPRGTALITVYRPVPYDLSSIGGPANGTLLEGIVQEIDIETGRVLLRWRALDHVKLTDSHEEVPSDPDDAFDHFHVNSIDIDHDGNLLVSARHTDTVYKIDRQTGEVIWRLGGKRSDFTFGPGARFFSQHDARRQPDGDITLFDNSNPPKVREVSRAIRLRIDEQRMTATLEKAVQHSLGLSSDSQGNMQTLPGGDIVVGWGSQPYFSRFDKSGETVFDARFPDDTDVYRTYQAPWSGRAPGRPAISVDVGDGGGLSVYASWNGATEVRRWQVLAGHHREDLHPVASAPWDGFESTIGAEGTHPYVAVRALGEGGSTLGTSRTLTLRPG